MSGDAEFHSDLVGNPAGLTGADMRWEGDTRPYLLFVDASKDTVGIGHTLSTVADERLTVWDGNISLLTTADIGFNQTTSAGSLSWYVNDNDTGEANELAAEIDFKGTDEWNESDAPANLEFRIKADADSLPDTKMVITQNGRVGINTTAPTSVLDVTGNEN